MIKLESFEIARTLGDLRDVERGVDRQTKQIQTGV